MTDDIPSPFRGAQPQILLLDVDGVLTNNQIWLNGAGEEWKAFCVSDGLGIKLLEKVGVKTVFISGRRSEVVHNRARELGLERHFSGIHDKIGIVREILDDDQIPAENAVFVGDDLIDIPPMREVGLPVAVANAHPEVIRIACAVTLAAGGSGAVREVCEWILHARGEWDQVVKSYIK